MKKLTAIILVSLFLSLAFCAQISQTEALRHATEWMSRISASNTISDLRAIANPNTDNQIDWYEITYNDGGFILISAEDKAVPILAYNPTGSLRTNALPSNLDWFLNQYHEEITIMRGTSNLAVHPAWEALRNGDFSAYLPNRPVSPLIQTTWDQDWPYNSLCPTSAQGPGGHVYAGCGATTMGQIMKFWAHPTQGTGSHTYTHPTYGTLSANFGATTYNFASMPNYLSWNPNTAISTLLFHCGVAVNMDYSPNGSGAYTNSIRPAFVSYFGYDPTASSVYKSSYSPTNWETLLKTDLDQGRPIFYHGQDPANGGHAWVCDGYQGTNYFHFNWGWSGYYDGYFYLTALNPGSYNFSTQQGAVIGIRPAGPLAAPSNLEATVDAGNMVYLEWDLPQSTGMAGFTVYRNGALHEYVPNPAATYYYDINLDPGTYQYYVTANYSSGESSPSNTAVATIYPAPVVNHQESFELMSDFATDLTPWFSFDLDSSPTLQFDASDFPGEGTALSFMVFNPALAVPPLPEFNALDGDKLLVSLPVSVNASNDWIVTPLWNTGNVAKLRFSAKSALTTNGLAKLKVGISTTNPQPAGMTIVSGPEPINIPNIWTEYEFTLTNNLYANVFAGIQCLSDNGSALLLDRFQLWTSYVANDDDQVPSVPEITLNVYPNPFKTSAHISWQQKSGDQTSLRVYDLKGRLIRNLSDVINTAGNHSLTWDGKDNQGKSAANGIYYCRLNSASGKTSTQKLVLMK